MGDHGPTGHRGIYGTCRLLISARKNIRRRRWRRWTTTTTTMTAKNIRLHEEKSDERGGGERHYGLPQQKRENCRVSREGQALSHRWTWKKEGQEGRKDTKGERTQKEGGHEGRKDTKGGRTWKEGGHEGREDMKGGNTNLSVAVQLYSWRHENYSELWGECPMNLGIVSRNPWRLSPFW